MPDPAQPLNVQADRDAPASTSALRPTANSAKAAEISSPHELTNFVETLLEQLDTKFDEMSSQILERMTQMSKRVDMLEASIQDIINGDNVTPASLPPSPLPSIYRRSDSSSTLS